MNFFWRKSYHFQHVRTKSVRQPLGNMSPPYFEAAWHVAIGFEARKSSPGSESRVTRWFPESHHRHHMWKSESDKNTQDARKGIDFRHPGETMCQVWASGTVDLVSTKKLNFDYALWASPGVVTFNFLTKRSRDRTIFWKIRANHIEIDPKSIYVHIFWPNPGAAHREFVKNHQKSSKNVKNRSWT